MYLADGGDVDVKLIEKILQKTTANPFTEESIETFGHLLVIRFAVSDYNAVFDGFAYFMRTNCLLDAAVGSERFDGERNMFYYTVMLVGSCGERQTAVSVKLYYDEYGFHSPQAEDIRVITVGSDPEKKLAGIFG